MLNSMFWAVARILTGCRPLTVYWWFRRLKRRFIFQIIHDACLMLDREVAGREAR